MAPGRMILAILRGRRRLFAAGPTFVCRAYIGWWGMVCRNLPPRTLGKCVEFAICHQGAAWQGLRFRAPPGDRR